MLTHWLTCLQPQRLSTKPSLLPDTPLQEKPPPPAQRGHPTRPNTEPAALSVTDSRQTLRATAAPAFESSLCFTYIVQDDANLCNCTPIGFSHPLITAYPHTQHKPFYALWKINAAQEGRAGVQLTPSQARGAAHRLFFAGNRRVKFRNGLTPNTFPRLF